MKELITIEQLGKNLNLTRATINSLRKKGLPTKKVGGSIRFDYEEVLEWIDRQSVKA